MTAIKRLLGAALFLFELAWIHELNATLDRSPLVYLDGWVFALGWIAAMLGCSVLVAWLVVDWPFRLTE